MAGGRTKQKKRIIEKFIRRRSAQTICQGDFLPSEIASIELAEKMKEHIIVPMGFRAPRHTYIVPTILTV